MRKIPYVVIAFILLSCKSNDNLVIDQKFERCINYRHSLQMDMYMTDTISVNANTEIKSNIFNYWENILLIDGHLEEVSKKAYSKLFVKILEPGVLDSSLLKFKSEIEFDPSYLMEGYSVYIQNIGCIDYLYRHLGLIDENDWRIKLFKIHDKIESVGNTDSNQFIIEMIDAVPQKSFENIIYRRQFLYYIYRTAANTK